MEDSEAIALLKKHAKNENDFDIVLRHSKAVQKVALKIAGRIENSGNLLDRQFISTASILHDIGRFVHPPGKTSIMHGVAGGELLRKEGLSEDYARVCETHIGPGITKEDIEEQDLPLPKKDFSPHSVEEKVICVADNLVVRGEDGHWDKEVGIEEPVERYTRKVNPKVGKRAKDLHDEVMELCKK